MGDPARHTPAVAFVLVTESAPQRRLFIPNDEHVNPEGQHECVDKQRQ
jgi:hypothetical protein